MASFGGVEEDFRKLEGVVDTAVSYMGGHLKNPEHEDVLTDRTGHAEVLPYQNLVKAFFESHNPSTTPGTKYKYRSTIFYHSPEQKEIAEGRLKELKLTNLYVYQVKTTVVNADVFYRGEESITSDIMKRWEGRLSFYKQVMTLVCLNDFHMLGILDLIIDSLPLEEKKKGPFDDKGLCKIHQCLGLRYCS